MSVDGWQPVREIAARPAPDRSRGVFETALVLGGRVVAWERHRERLAASCRELYGAALERGLDRRLAALAAPHARARLRVVARPAAAGAAAVVIATEVTALGGASAGAGAPAFAPVRVAGGYGGHKLVDRDWLDEIERAVGAGARPLLVNAAGEALETTRANVFALSRGSLATPSLDGAILPGVTRALLIEQARRLGIEVREGPLALEELQRADAVALTGSLRLVEARVQRRESGVEVVVATLRAAVAEAAAAGDAQVRERMDTFLKTTRAMPPALVN